MATFKFKARGRDIIREFSEGEALSFFQPNVVENLKNGHVAGYVFKDGAVWISHK